MNDERPVLNQFNLVVRDMAATIAFYRRLGLRIEEGQTPWSAHHVTAAMPEGIDLDFDSEEFTRQWNKGWPGSKGVRMGVLGFGVSSRDAVDAVYNDLTGAGYRGQQPPYDAIWGARYAIVEDPDGNAVGIMSPIDPQRRSSPQPPQAQ